MRTPPATLLALAMLVGLLGVNVGAGVARRVHPPAAVHFTDSEPDRACRCGRRPRLDDMTTLTMTTPPRGPLAARLFRIGVNAPVAPTDFKPRVTYPVRWRPAETAARDVVVRLILDGARHPGGRRVSLDAMVELLRHGIADADGHAA